MSSRTVDFPGSAASSAAGTEGFSRANPVCTEIGVSVQGSSHASANGQTSQPFLEQTTTVIVFAQGAVVRLSDTVAPGQILIVRHLQSNEEAACRVVSVKTNPNVKGYVELEFLQPAPNFWGKEFQSASAAKTPSAAAPRPVAPIRAEHDASPIRADRDAAPASAERDSSISAPKAPAAPRPITPVPAARSTVSPVDTTNTAAASGLSFLPDLLDTLALPGEAKQRATEATQRLDAIRTTPPPIRAERDSSQQAAPPRPPLAPWPSVPAAPKTDAAKVAPSAGDARYVSDLLDTLTPLGETILRDKPKSAPQQPQVAPPAPAFSKPAFAASTVADIALQPFAAEPPAAPAHASSTHFVPIISPEVAPMLAESEVIARGQLFGVDVAPAKTAKGLPKPMRILAIAAAVALALAAGAGIYRWQKKAASDANLAASSQPAESAPVSATQPAAIAAPPATAAAAPVAAPSVSNPSATAQPTTNASASTTKSSAAARAAKSSPAPRGTAVAGTAISAPSAAARSTNQAAPSIGGAMPNVAQSASAGLLSEGPSSGPAAPPPAHISTGVVQPQLLGRAPAPIYPDAAKAQHVQGDVSVDLAINEMGKIAGMAVLSGPAALRQAALDALRQRKYAPAMLDGKPTATHIVVVVHFQL